MEGYKTTLCFPEFEASSIYAMQHHHSTAKSDRQEIAWTVHQEMCSSNQSYSTEEPGKMNLPLLVQQLHRHIGIHGRHWCGNPHSFEPIKLCKLHKGEADSPRQCCDTGSERRGRLNSYIVRQPILIILFEIGCRTNLPALTAHDKIKRI